MWLRVRVCVWLCVYVCVIECVCAYGCVCVCESRTIMISLSYTNDNVHTDVCMCMYVLHAATFLLSRYCHVCTYLHTCVRVCAQNRSLYHV